ncbi:DEIH-box ATPase [Gaertneriomyces sp. JEL0708]|nr:DEIH-box ATPase [Gaertneriomyces sp. JEL0708]
MAEDVQRAQQYQYTANSNLVLQADRSALPRRDQEPSGEPETLWGRLDPKRMGDRVQRSIQEQKDKVEKKRKEKVEKMRKAGAEREAKKSKREASQGYGYGNILTATEDFEGEVYRPRTQETKQTFELLLSFLQQLLGDIPQDVLRGAANEVLATLKDDTKKDFDKKKEVEEIVGTQVASERFAQLVNLGKRITDYRAGGDQDTDEADDMDVARDALDEDYGVAVVFDEDEEADEESDDEYEVRDGDAEEEDAEVEEDGTTGPVLKAVGADDDDEDREDIDEFTEIIPAALKEAKSADPFAVGAGAPVVKPHDVDAFWLQRRVAADYSDPHTAQAKTEAAFQVLASSANARDAENELMALFDYDKFDLVKLLTRNRDVIVWCTRLAKAGSPEERSAIEKEMAEKQMHSILDQLSIAPARKDVEKTRRGVVEMDVDEKPTAGGPIQFDLKKPQMKTGQIAPQANIDLQALTFAQGGHLMSNKKCSLPQGTFKREKKGFQEVHVPAPKPAPMKESETLVPISSLPQWAQGGFAGAKSLNRIQSRVYDSAFNSDENMLICAPTGAGKTNCAMLTILREIGKYRDERTGEINLDAFKIIYIAPMKALVAEMVGNFSRRLECFGVKVAELTGDRQLTKQQIADTQVIVTTPEKWDITTRKATDRSYTNLVRLLIVDEIHLLHDERGPVLESVISRTIRQIQQTQEMVRLLGLSATLPNYQDVAHFMRVKPDTGLFYFDNTFRPVPLKQQYIGITEKKAIKRFQLMNEICYEKIMEEAGKNQVLVFCHSRKETAKTAKAIRDLAMDKDTISQILKQDAASREILATEAETCKNSDLQDLLPYGFAIHHAGMTRADRTLVEELFADGHVQVLVSTATLAWGVNLPAHTVIIKGTQVYNPEKGRWVELSPQDVLQMLGRAGRPQFDTHGEGIIITTHQELQYYLSLLNQQLPIESQFISRLADHLNAEIALGTVRDREEAVQWLGYTYLYVRMLRNGALYGVSVDEAESDPYLVQRRVDLVHAAAGVLDKCGLIKYDRKTGRLAGTELGRIASHYYIGSDSMGRYNQHLKPSMGMIDLFRVFAVSEEFKYIPVREEERLELAKMLERVPIPVKESLEDPMAKINVLLQAYISGLKLEGFALVSDMVYVTQSAGRILRAIYEICLKRGWARVARSCLEVCKMVDRRMWGSMNPLRQVRGFPIDLVRRLERKEFSWDRYWDLNPQELGELCGVPKMGKVIHKAVHSFPKVELGATVQPVTRSLIRVELTITPDFMWDDKVCPGGGEMFWIFVEDCDGESILYHDTWVLKGRYVGNEHRVVFTVPVFEPVSPNYFIRVISDRWVGCESRLAVSLRHLILPEKYPPPTELLDLQPLPVSALGNPVYEKIYDRAGFGGFFNAVQTQCFNALYTKDDNVFIGAASGVGKGVCAEFALMRLWNTSPKSKCVYVGPSDAVVEKRHAEWKSRFEGLGKRFGMLTGELAGDLKVLESSDVVLSTADWWDMLSRRWKVRKGVQAVGLTIFDEVHMVGGEGGPTMEVVISRMRFMGVQLEKNLRIVALGVSLANARDLGEWIGAPVSGILNFGAGVRRVPMEIQVRGWAMMSFDSLMIAMGRSVYESCKAAGEGGAIVFAPGRKWSINTAFELVAYASAEGDSSMFLGCEEADIIPIADKLVDNALKECVRYGVGFYYEGMNAADRRAVEDLFMKGALRVVICSRDTCWGMRMRSSTVVIMGTQFWEGKEHRYVDYPVTDVLEMMGRATRVGVGETARGVLMCPGVKKEFYKKFLWEGLPVESHLDLSLHDVFCGEIVNGVIESKQDAVDYLTWTFLYRRMGLNPNYYGLTGTTHTHLSDHLSDLVERTLDDLENSKMVSCEDDEVSPLNLGMIASYYGVSYVSVEVMSLSVTAKTKVKGLLQILVACAEFESLPVRKKEEGVLKRIYDRCVVRVEEGKADFADPHFKALILLQAHFMRIKLPGELEEDLKWLLRRCVRLLYAMVDVVSSFGFVGPCLGTMDLCQCVVQATWVGDSVLKQIPHFTTDVIQRCEKAKVEGVWDLVEMEEADREKLLEFNRRDMADVARFVNRYPSIDVSYDLSDKEVPMGESVVVTVTLTREMDEDAETSDPGPVIAPFYPGVKVENWWVLVGDDADKTVLGIKRIVVGREGKVKLEVPVEKEQIKGRIWVVGDSWVGADQEYDFTLTGGERREVASDDDVDTMEE